MKVSFYLERNKNLKTKERTIWCYVREKGNGLYLNTGERINPDFWDKTVQRANLRKTRNKIVKGHLQRLNQYLNAYENKIYEIAHVLKIKDVNVSFNAIAVKIKNYFRKKDNSFFTVFDEFIKFKSVKVSKASLQKFLRVKALLREYEKEYKTKLDFEKITNIFFEKFYLFLITKKGMLNNTAHKTIQFFKTFMIWANENDYTQNDSYKSKSFRLKSEENEVIYLTEDELMKLYNMEISNERLKRVRDIFVFQCFTGVRYSDIQNIDWEDIKTGIWKLRTQKTHQIIEIPLNHYALSILAKYKEYPQPLPVISNQKINKYLKELCKLAGINSLVKIIRYRGKNRIEKVYQKYEVIGTHTARRTFISLSLQKGMKPDVIMAITGHTTYRMMQRYLKIANEHKREEMEKTWGGPLTQMK